MDENKFRQFIIALRSMEMEGRTAIDVFYFTGMNDLTEEQKKIVTNEFGKVRTVERVAPVYFENDFY